MTHKTWFAFACCIFFASESSLNHQKKVNNGKTYPIHSFLIFTFFLYYTPFRFSALHDSPKYNRILLCIINFPLLLTAWVPILLDPCSNPNLSFTVTITKSTYFDLPLAWAPNYPLATPDLNRNDVIQVKLHYHHPSFLFHSFYLSNFLSLSSFWYNFSRLFLSFALFPSLSFFLFTLFLFHFLLSVTLFPIPFFVFSFPLS